MGNNHLGAKLIMLYPNLLYSETSYNVYSELCYNEVEI